MLGPALRAIRANLPHASHHADGDAGRQPGRAAPAVGRRRHGAPGALAGHFRDLAARPRARAGAGGRDPHGGSSTRRSFSRASRSRPIRRPTSVTWRACRLRIAQSKEFGGGVAHAVGAAAARRRAPGRSQSAPAARARASSRPGRASWSCASRETAQAQADELLAFGRGGPGHGRSLRWRPGASAAARRYDPARFGTRRRRALAANAPRDRASR